jgi:hypothetical protein
MRRTIFALTAIFLAPTTVMASQAGGELARGSEWAGAAAIQGRQIAPGSGLAIDKRDYLGGNVILAKGDQSGTGGGHGGHKGQKKGGHHGKQKEGKDKDKKS